ncbi:DUF4091 domain-containing protein [Anaerococcus sp.]|uniref:DUF4091 domain-containing protein n=1 Tax=Anaerococcus sp. TaxID=1872515 RepID=UPI0027BAC07A|nr:DUF4091 domain-containing protein [Anaerococcus sp.]
MGDCKIELFEVSPYVRGGFVYENFDYAYKGDLFSASFIIENVSSDNLYVRIEPSSLRFSEASISSDYISIRIVQKARGHIGRGYDRTLMPDFPKIELDDIIDYKSQARIKTNSSLRFFYYVDFPKDAKPGLYKGEINIYHDNSNYKFEFSIELLDLCRKESSFDINLWQYPFSSYRFYKLSDKELFGKRHLDILSKHLLLYKALSGKTLTTTIVDEPWAHQTYDDSPSMVRGVSKGGSYEFDYSYFDSFVGLGESYNMLDKIYAFSLISWRAATKDKKFRQIFLPDFIEHLDELGYFDKTYIGIDERDEGEVRDAIDFLSNFKNKDGKSFKIAYQTSFDKDNIKLFNRIEDVSFILSSVDDDCISYVRDRRKKGLFTSIYTCTGEFPNTFLYSEPFEATWLILFSYLNGFDGFLRWALDAWVKDPRQDTSFFLWESRDSFLIYPSTDNRKNSPSPSLSFEGMRIGLMMVEKIAFIRKTLKGYYLEQFEKEIPRLRPKTSFENEYGARVSSRDELVKTLEEVEIISKLIYKYSRIIEEEFYENY